jgi:hypothetical protein
VVPTTIVVMTAAKIGTEETTVVTVTGMTDTQEAMIALPSAGIGLVLLLPVVM